MKKRKKKKLSASLSGGWSVGSTLSAPKRCAVKGCDNGVRDRSNDQLCRVCLDRLERGMVPTPLIESKMFDARWRRDDEPPTIERKLLSALVRVLSEEYLEHD